jgi:ArsR family transcriptional regulator, arsenate/arsenite/antimonite-responsive transcriptional repressor
MSAAGTTASQPTAECCLPPADDAVERLARLAKALADPIRLRMLDLMTQGRGCCGLLDPAVRGVPGTGDPQGICVCEFQERFGLAQSKTSYHLRVLREAGLVNEETRGKWTFYSVDDQAAAAALAQIGALLRT